MSLLAPDGAARMLRWFVCLSICLLGALLLCSGVFYFDGHRVDESEVVMNAMAIAAGGWTPEWAGYGHLAMYLPAMAIAAAALFLQFSGAASNYADAIYLLFQDDAAYRITRFLYTLADIGTAVLFAKLIVKVTGQRIVALCFLAYFAVSPDTWLYANYIRTDTLVSFFTAAAVYALARDRTRVTPYLVGIAIGAAIACKYSAITYLALMAVFLLGDPDRQENWKRRVSTAVIASVAMLAAAFLLQPRFNFMGVLSNAAIHISGSHFTQEQAPIGQRLARLWQLATTVEPLALVLLLGMWFALLRFKRSAALLIAVLVGIIPFGFSNYPREYWLLPFADAVRAAGWLGAACAVEFLRRRGGDGSGRWALAAVLVAAAAIIGTRIHRWHEVRPDPLRQNNTQIAKQWLYLHAANRIPLAYAYEKNQILPRAYSFADYADAAALSRIFIFERQKFEALHKLFKRRLYSKDYAEFSRSTMVPPLILSVSSETADRLGGDLQLCAGKRCHAPATMACDRRLKGIMGDCRAYRWDMDSPELQSDLSTMTLRLGSRVPAFSLCWYTCGNGDAWRITRRSLVGEVKLLDLSKLLFAPQAMKPLDQIVQSRAGAAGELIVASPTAYVPWLKKKGLPPGTDAADALSRLLDAGLVKRFESGSGPVIEIYERPAAATEKEMSNEMPATAAAAG